MDLANMQHNIQKLKTESVAIVWFLGFDISFECGILSGFLLEVKNKYLLTWLLWYVIMSK